MRFLKKTLLGILGLMAVLAISLFAFKSYRTSQAKKLRIPKNIEAIVRVELDELLFQMGKNSLGNWSIYYGTKSKDSLETKTGKIWNTGLEIPAIVYFYSFPDKPATYFGVFDVKDQTKALRFLESNFDWKPDSTISESNGAELWVHQKQVSLLFYQNKLVLAISKDKQIPQDQMVALAKAEQMDWILATEFLDGKQDLVPAEIMWVDQDNNNLSISFDAGTASLSGLWKSELFQFPESPIHQHQITSDSLLLNLELNTDLALLLKDQKPLLDSLKLPIDSLDQFVGNYLNLRMYANPVLQEETIVSYDYDDNFEMIEKKAVQTTEVPSLLFKIKASPHLLTYLPEKLFYKFYKAQGDGLLALSTNPALLVGESNIKPSKEVAKLVYKRSELGTKFLGWLPAYDQIKMIRVNGTAVHPKTVSIFGNINFEKPGVYGFYQLLGN